MYYYVLLVLYLISRLIVYPSIRLIKQHRNLKKIYKLYPYELFQDVYQKKQGAEGQLNEEISSFLDLYPHLVISHAYQQFIRTKIKRHNGEYKLKPVDYVIIVILMLLALV